MQQENKLKTRRVAIVDDNAILRVIFSNMIKGFPDFHLEVHLFENALDFFDKKNNYNPDQLPDILFVDISMPFMTGWEMMDKLEADLNFVNKVTIYIVSSSTCKIDQEQLDHYPFINGYLVKPIDKFALFDIIRQIN
ncbi:response regulator [Sphingobacterium sp. SRCM116780]|uniref:response regulator n=1 Tax=Sphingobacterium sp. SRCM116780 TaxID=2907623 RepID=UPI001F2CF428|nr:response regulator [Sphingobacterium sp. SRCM116780]UIR55285.1 response regulator [Sphingobacterium sp. SRCM116780]